MNTLFWLVLVASAATLIGMVRYIRRKAEERRLAEEARVAAFVSSFDATPRPSAGSAEGVAPPPALAPAQPSSAAPNGIALQKLLFEAAHKAGEAGEPALAVQLYARLLSRYPDTGLAEPARAAVVALHKKVVKS
jgi:hypothetical protein